MPNEKIKRAAKEKNVRLWKVAKMLNIQDSALSRKMREELPEEETARILAIIDQLAPEKQEAI